MNTLLGIVFPGQGSQFVGMLREIAYDFPEIETTFLEASSVLGYDLWQLVQQGPASELDKTVHTQPALLTASYAIWRLLQTTQHCQPAVLAGHSLGEYTALVCANAIAFADALRLVAARGQFMQDAVPVGEGGMAAIIGLDDATIISICKKSALAGEIVSPANFNSPGQVVIAGNLIAVERALVLAKEAGARMVKVLPVSVPSHCHLMQSAAERLSALLAVTTIHKPTLSVVNNVDVAMYDSPNAIRDGLIRQLYMPVRWVETIQLFSQMGIKHIVECGPGKVLNGLNKRIVHDMQLTNTADTASLRGLLEAISELPN